MIKPNWQTPLFSHLVQFAQSKPQSYHVPGHRNGKIYDSLRQYSHSHDDHQVFMEALARLAQLDVTELSHTDDLHDPQDIIARAQQLCAELYGVRHTFFLVGGSTAGNLALILALCGTEDIIIVQRNVHKSIINACKLAGARVVFLRPEIDRETELSVVPSYEALEQALMKYPNAKAVFFTNPNYYGISAELRPYIELAHRYHIPFIVDEAHGAHYGIAPHSPLSSIIAGADAVVHSAHKTLPALTMGAYLHINSERVDKTTIQQQLAIIESSSPSYLIMASLDVARATLMYCGREAFEQTYSLSQSFIAWMEKHSERLLIKRLSSESNFRQDPYRILLYDRNRQWSGYQLQRLLESYGIWAEMANEQYVVLIWHMDMRIEQLEQLQQAVARADQQLGAEQAAVGAKQQLGEEQVVVQAEQLPSMPISSLTDYLLEQSLAYSVPVRFGRRNKQQSITIKLSEAENYICAEEVIPYPPGIPILYEGETITKAHIDEILAYVEVGAKFQGGELITRRQVKVFAL